MRRQLAEVAVTLRLLGAGPATRFRLLNGGMMSGTRGRALMVAMTLVAASTLAGCAAEAVSSPSPTPVEPEVTPTPTPTADAEADVLTAYYRYWQANVESQRGNPDPALFDGVATGALVENRMAEARHFAEYGISREGEPSFSDVVVEIADESAYACVDYSGWMVPDAVGDAPDVLAGGVELTLVDGAWLAVAHVEAPEQMTCEE